MTIHHHIADDLLIAYAAGDLDESWSLVVATHLALCASCRVAVRQAEAVGGVLIEDIEPVSVAEKSMDAVMARISTDQPHDAMDPQPNPARVHRDTGIVFPQPLRDYIDSDLDGVAWRRLGRGAYHLPITAGSGSVRLLRIPAGKPVPDHSHNGRELTLVLQGSFHDQHGEFLRGDVEDCDDSIQHHPIAGADQDCICLAVTDAPLRFTSLAARIVQPFIGI